MLAAITDQWMETTFLRQKKQQKKDFRSALLLPLHLYPDFLNQSELSEQALDIGKQWNLSDLHLSTNQVQILVARFTRSAVTPQLSLSVKPVLTNRSLNLSEMQVIHIVSISCKFVGLWVLNYFGNVSAPLLIPIYRRYYNVYVYTHTHTYIYTMQRKVIFSETDWTKHSENVCVSKYKSGNVPLCSPLL